MACLGRFAPSPSGRIHLGNILCCLLAWLSARQKGEGSCCALRIWTLPAVPGATLTRWRRTCGGWACTGTGGLARRAATGPTTRASGQRSIRRRWKNWREWGWCIPASVPERSSTPPVLLTAATDRPSTPVPAVISLAPQIAERAKARAPALRLRVPEEEIVFRDGHMGLQRQRLDTECGDFLLRRSDGLFAYQLAVVVDDAAMGVTEVVRGADLLDSTPRQLLLYRLLGLRAPEFYHFPLLLACDGRRLSKRDADAGLDVLRPRTYGGGDPGKAGISGRLQSLCRAQERGSAAGGLRLG